MRDPILKKLDELKKNEANPPPRQRGRPKGVKNPQATPTPRKKKVFKPLPNPRREKFALNLFLGMTQLKAYVDAGFKPSPPSASILAKRPEIKQRMAEFKQEAEDSRLDRFADNIGPEHDPIFDLQWACLKLDSLRKIAEEQGSFREARICIEEICTLKGIGVNKNTGNSNDNNRNVPSLGTVNLQVLIDTAKKSGDRLGNIPENLRDITPGLPQLVDKSDRGDDTDKPTEGDGLSQDGVRVSVHGAAETSST